jgi:hypothetical protein
MISSVQEIVTAAAAPVLLSEAASTARASLRHLLTSDPTSCPPSKHRAGGLAEVPDLHQCWRSPFHSSCVKVRYAATTALAALQGAQNRHPARTVVGSDIATARIPRRLCHLADGFIYVSAYTTIACIAGV